MAQLETPTMKPASTTITTDLGEWVLRRRTAADEVEILRRASTLMACEQPSDLLVNFTYVLAALEVLAERVPPGVVLAELDRDDINAAWNKYAEWLQSFRKPATPDKA